MHALQHADGQKETMSQRKSKLPRLISWPVSYLQEAHSVGVEQHLPLLAALFCLGCQWWRRGCIHFVRQMGCRPCSAKMYLFTYLFTQVVRNYIDTRNTFMLTWHATLHVSSSDVQEDERPEIDWLYLNLNSSMPYE